MHQSVVRSVTIASLLLGLGVFSKISASEVSAGGDKTVSKMALGIVSGIHGSWPQMPGKIATWRMTSGALIGNGSVGVAIGGTPEQQEFYVGRDDFWSVLRGRIMPVGRLQLTIPALQGGSSEVRENIGPADVTASIAEGDNKLKSRSWVAAGRNVFFVQLENTGRTGLPISAEFLDAFGRDDRKNLGGAAGDVDWLRVSPEVVDATIGGSNQRSTRGPFEPAAAPQKVAAISDAGIRSVQIFSGYFEHAPAGSQEKPLYAWASQGVLAGKSGGAGAASPGVFSCGDIIMPQRRFTVRASINARHADGEGILFSALVNHRWMKQTIDPTDPIGNVRGHDVPRAQGADAGLVLYLSKGRIAANLNGTVVTANRSVPLNQWVRVGAAYDGMKLVLLMNGVEVGETTNFPTAAEVMGPKWKWAAAHPGDAQIPFDGCAPEGILAMRIIGARVSSEKGGIHFTIPAGGRVTVAVAVMDNRDTEGYFHRAISDLQQASAKTIAATWSRHLVWWRKFWSKSFIEIPDKTVQAWWYGSLYVLASCSRQGNVAPGLWGNWITSTRMGWQGDYTLDYNYQAPFWAAFPTNHVGLADPYDAPILAWMERGRALAKKLHAQGLFYYTHLAPSPGWSADNFRSLDQKSDALFAAVNCVQRWHFTRDAAYARKVWPFLTGVADYWDHELKLVNGRYVDFNDAPDEHLWGSADDVNPATTIGFLNMLYPALIEMSHQLNTGQEMRATWSRILSHLSRLPIAPADTVAAIRDAAGTSIPAGSMVILQSERGMKWVRIQRGDRFSANPPVRVMGSSAGMNSLQVVFPAWNIGIESSPKLRQAAVNTVNYMRLWYDSNDTSSFYPAAADAGYDPESILAHLHLLVTHIGYLNFAYNIGAGGVENEATIPTTISAMLLQSYQKNIHVFADWPKNEDASFGDLLAVGDFLVSSRISAGKIGYVRIISQRGGMCHLANPWGPDQEVQLRIAGRPARVLHGAAFSIPTRMGEKLLFTPVED